MKIMATSDLHGNLDGLDPRGADVVVLAGEHDTLRRWFSKIPTGLDVLVTHSPPRIPGSDVDRSLQTDSEHFGSSELTEAITEKRPGLVFCGHIHTGLHGGVDFEGSRIYNVSRLDERYEIAYDPTWVDI